MAIASMPCSWLICLLLRWYHCVRRVCVQAVRLLLE